jgi:DNA-binding transcriptional LysR family regulator
MALAYLRVFSYVEAIARAGSVRKAAETLFITPSALDRRIQELEATLGAGLFERHARGMRLTAAGELFLLHVRTQRADFERVQAEIEHLRGLRRGTVALAASQALGFTVLPDLVDGFRRSHPGIGFKVRIAERQGVVAALRAFEADLGLVYNPQRSSDLATLMQVEQQLCAVMAVDHPLAAREAVTMRDCLQYPLAMPDAGLGSRATLDAFFNRSSLTPRIVIESNSFEMLRNFVRCNDAVSFQIQIGAPLLREREGVTARPIDERSFPVRPLTVAQLKGRHLPQPALRFIEALRERLRPALAG